MANRPAVNPDVHDIADRAKHRYAIGAKLLAAMQYRLAELAGTGRLDADESIRLQHNLVSIWEALYFGTVCACGTGTPTTAPGMRPTTHTATVVRSWSRSVSSLGTARTSAGSTTESCSMKVRSTSIRSERSATSRPSIPRTIKSATWAMKRAGLTATGTMTEDRALPGCSPCRVRCLRRGIAVHAAYAASDSPAGSESATSPKRPWPMRGAPSLAVQSIQLMTLCWVPRSEPLGMGRNEIKHSRLW